MLVDITEVFSTGMHPSFFVMNSPKYIIQRKEVYFSKLRCASFRQNVSFLSGAAGYLSSVEERELYALRDRVDPRPLGLELEVFACPLEEAAARRAAMSGIWASFKEPRDRAALRPVGFFPSLR
jgi:hypothetical protein